ncbi:hypothetical protein IWZ01DRAFT_574889 [Phyllosticta capitalensis]
MVTQLILSSSVPNASFRLLSPQRHLRTFDGRYYPQVSTTSSEQKMGERSPAPSKQDGCLFFQLPQELRDRIYEYALIVGVVQIEPVRCDDRQHTQRRHFLQSPLRCSSRPVHQRTIRRDPGMRAMLTYELARFSQQAPIAIFQTCRQIYQESSEIFYSKNQFFFECRDDGLSIPMAISFFRDRPARVMSWIKSIKVIVGSVADSLFDIFDDRDNEELRADMLLFTYLLKFRLTALEHLSLIFYGWPPDLRKGEYQEEVLRGEVGKTSPAGMLLLLPKYRRLSVEVRSYPTTAFRTLTDPDAFRPEDGIPPGLLGTPMSAALPLAFAALVRSCLLRGGERLGAANVVVHH